MDWKPDWSWRNLRYTPLYHIAFVCAMIWHGWFHHFLLIFRQTAEERHASLRKLRRYSPSTCVGEDSPLPGYAYRTSTDFQVLHACNTPYSQGSVVCMNPEHMTVSPKWVTAMNRHCTRSQEDDHCPCQEYNHGVKCLLMCPMYVLKLSEESKPTGSGEKMSFSRI